MKLSCLGEILRGCEDLAVAAYEWCGDAVLVKVCAANLVRILFIVYYFHLLIRRSLSSKLVRYAESVVR